MILHKEKQINTVSKTNEVRCLLTRKQCLINCLIKQHVDDWVDTVRCIATAGGKVRQESVH